MIPFVDATGSSLADRKYAPLFLGCSESAAARVWVTTFIFDIRPHRDLEGEVLDLAAVLVERRRIGVDVRVLLPGFVRTPDIDVANLAAGLFLTKQGVPVRRLFLDEKLISSHSKFAVIDDVGIVGSHNLTDDGFRLNIEDSAVFKGEPVDYLAGEFLRLWSIAKGMPKHEPQTRDSQANG